MAKEVKRIAVTGGAGNIAYNLLFRIAAGALLGKEQPIALHIMEIPKVVDALEGVKMELEDCTFSLLKEIRIGCDPMEMFRGVDYALLVGGKPRGPGMERKDLLYENGKIFVEQGYALNAMASPDCKVLVVANPCNTSCLIAMHHAPNLPRKNFHAMTHLDQNRAIGQLMVKTGAHPLEISNMIIWGNHSPTQVPDWSHVKIGRKPITDIIADKAWLDGDFITTVQERGAAIIAARGKSSAASAANAALDGIRNLVIPTRPGDWFSSGVCSDGNPYGIEENLIFSMPCRSNGDGNYEVVPGLEWSQSVKEKIKITEQELIEERELVKDLLVVS